MRSILFVLFVCFLQTSNAATYYFSAISGNDSRTPSQAKNSSTPWKSLSKLNSYFSSLQPGDVVLFKRGETFYGSIIVNKSGTSASPIVIGAYGSGSKPVITSLVTLKSWVSKGNGIWESYNSSFGSKVNMVLLNGAQQELGRYPNSSASNKGYLIYESHNSKSSITDNQLTSTINWKGAEVVIRGRRWILDRNLITAHSGTKISYTATSSYAPYDKYGYFIQNSIKTLDKLGEWYYNPSSKKLSVYFGSNSPSSYTIQAATKDNVIWSEKFKNIRLENLNIKGSNSSVVYMKYGSNINIKSCDIQFSGRDGVEAKFNTNFKIESSTITNSGNDGINLGYSGDYAVIKNNKISNSFIFAGGGVSGDNNGVGILSCGNYSTIENNEIKNTGSIGIWFTGNYVTIKNNFVNGFCTIKDDGAGIYTHTGSSAECKGRKVISNIVINGIGAPEGTSNTALSAAEGIYTDNNAANVEITGNTVANCANQGIYIHSSYAMKIANNTLYNNNKRQLSMIENTDNSKIRNCTISSNIIFSKLTTQTLAYISSPYDDKDLFGKFSNNYYARPSDSKNAEYKTKVQAIESGANFLAYTNTVRFEYNATSSDKKVSLDAIYVDVKKTQYSGTITLAPFTSVVLIKSSSQKSTSTSPVVSLVDPVAGATYKKGAAVHMRANASDADGSIKKVEFYKGSTLLHTETSAPYGWYWQNVPAGNYTITAKATDNSGKVTTSAAVSISVTSSRPAINDNDTSSNNDTSATEIAISNKTESISFDFGLFPNPAVNTIKISFNQLQYNNQKASLSIFSMSGSLEKNIPVLLSGKTIDIDISSLSAGMYILRLTGDGFNINKKFIKTN